jgi:hypothetical protein
MSKVLLAAALGAVLSASTLPAAAQDAGTEPSEAEKAALGTHQRNLRVSLGMRTQLLKGSGYDPFSTNDALNQVSLGASWAFWAQDQLSIAANLGYDYGGSSAVARSDQAELQLHRFKLAPELRYHVLRVLAVTASVGPTLSYQRASLSGALQSDLVRTQWKPGFEATAGVAAELWGYKSGASHRPRLWIIGEGGYGWTAPMALGLKPESPSMVPERINPLSLDDLSVSGPLMRISAALSFW